MAAKKVQRVRTVQISNLGTGNLVQEVGLPDNVAQIEFLSIGDITSNVGYVEALRIDEKQYCPKGAPDWDTPLYQPGAANRVLETRTYCLVTLSTKVDQASSLEEFRILYDNSLEGERLAVSMAVVALLKDAVVHRRKVKLQGMLSELKFNSPGAFMNDVSDQYFELKSVELLRT